MGLMGLLRGKSAEQIAAKFLRKQGLSILGNNETYKCGEIDLIATDQDQHIFVEVKFRNSDDFGSAAEMIQPDKQMKIARAAKTWLQKHDPNFEKACRFDVIAITGKDPSNGNIEWIKNAFQSELW